MIGPVIQAELFGRDQRERRIGKIFGIARRANLIADHSHAPLLTSQPQHRCDKVAALAATADRAIQPARPNDEMPCPAGTHRLFAIEFALPLKVLRQFLDADITNQQLLDQSIVLVNGVRIALNLQQELIILHTSFHLLSLIRLPVRQILLLKKRYMRVIRLLELFHLMT